MRNKRILGDVPVVWWDGFDEVASDWWLGKESIESTPYLLPSEAANFMATLPSRPAAKAQAWIDCALLESERPDHLPRILHYLPGIALLPVEPGKKTMKFAVAQTIVQRATVTLPIRTMTLCLPSLVKTANMNMAVCQETLKSPGLLRTIVNKISGRTAWSDLVSGAQLVEILLAHQDLTLLIAILTPPPWYAVWETNHCQKLQSGNWMRLLAGWQNPQNLRAWLEKTNPKILPRLKSEYLYQYSQSFQTSSAGVIGGSAEKTVAKAPVISAGSMERRPAPAIATAHSALAVTPPLVEPALAPIKESPNRSINLKPVAMAHPGPVEPAISFQQPSVLTPALITSKKAARSPAVSPSPQNDNDLERQYALADIAAPHTGHSHAPSAVPGSAHSFNRHFAAAHPELERQRQAHQKAIGQKYVRQLTLDQEGSVLPISLVASLMRSGSEYSGGQCLARLEAQSQYSGGPCLSASPSPQSRYSGGKALATSPAASAGKTQASVYSGGMLSRNVASLLGQKNGGSKGLPLSPTLKRSPTSEARCH